MTETKKMTNKLSFYIFSVLAFIDNATPPSPLPPLTPKGTHWYHSHASVQRMDGIYGSFVVKTARQADPNSHLYHEDKRWGAKIAISWILRYLVTTSQCYFVYAVGVSSFSSSLRRQAHSPKKLASNISDFYRVCWRLRVARNPMKMLTDMVIYWIYMNFW